MTANTELAEPTELTTLIKLPETAKKQDLQKQRGFRMKLMKAVISLSAAAVLLAGCGTQVKPEQSDLSDQQGAATGAKQYEAVEDETENVEDRAEDQADVPVADEALQDEVEADAETETTQIGEISKISEIRITSQDLQNDGSWNPAITNTASGANRSPELSWTEVEGATEYVIYMTDPDGNNWLHWRAHGITDTHLDNGAQIPASEYIGPYPPSGTHHYIITVYALKAPALAYPGNFDAAGNDMAEIEKELDLSADGSGNIIGKGSLTGTFTAGTAL